MEQKAKECKKPYSSSISPVFYQNIIHPEFRNPIQSSVSDRAISLLSVRTWITPRLYRPEQQHVDTFSPSPLKGLCGISMLIFGGYHSNRAILASIRCQAYRFAKSFANL